MTRAAEHYSFSAREIKHLPCLLRCADISVRKHRHPRYGLDVSNGLVLRISLIKIRARSSVHGQSLNATGCGDTRNGDSVAVLAIPTRADLERHWDGHCAHDALQDACHERFVLEQR